MQTTMMDGFETYISIELGLSKETLLAYTQDVSEFLVFVEQRELTAKLIEDFMKYLRKKKLSSATIRRKYMSIRCLCNHMISLNRLNPNTLNMIDSIRVERKMLDVLCSEDVDALVATVHKRKPLLRGNNIRRDVSIILTLYHSGLRVSELCSLDISGINFSKREIRVIGKGGKERIIPTTNECIKSIKAYINSCRESNTDAVFVKSDGSRITRRAVSDMLMSASRRSGIKNTTAHMLRRTCATSLMNNGMDLELVKSMLGHRHLSTTQNYLVISLNRLKGIHQRCHPFGGKV